MSNILKKTEGCSFCDDFHAIKVFDDKKLFRLLCCKNLFAGSYVNPHVKSLIKQQFDSKQLFVRINYFNAAIEIHQPSHAGDNFVCSVSIDCELGVLHLISSG